MIKRDEEVWKVQHPKYHIKAKVAKPRINWLIETAGLAWDRKQIWRKISRDNCIPTDFDYRKRTHVKLVIKAALEKAF